MDQIHNTPFGRTAKPDVQRPDSAARRRHSGWRTGAYALTFAALALAGCAKLTPAKGRVTEFKSGTVPNVDYKTIAVIAADDNTNNLRMSSSVRNDLRDLGYNAIRRSGRWASEEDALIDICRPGQEEPVQGVLIVAFDALTLRECTSKQVAYKINGGGRLNLPDLTQHLVTYIRSVASRS